MSQGRSRLAAGVRWIAPSVVAACLAASVAGLVEGIAGGLGLIGAPASAGYAALLAVPTCLLGSLLVRGLWAAWRPHRLAETLIEDGGGAPRLAGWIGFLLFGAFVLSWTTFNGTRMISQLTTFKVNVVSLALPIIVVVAAAILAALSRPLVDVLSAALRALDRRARARLGRSLVTPRIILGGTVTLGLVLLLIGWYVTISPRIGPLDTDILLHPAIAIAITAGAHPLWARLRPTVARWAMAAPTAALTVAIAAAATWVRLEHPSLMLSIWAEPTVGGLAVETVFDVDVLRSKASLEKYTPVPRPGAPRRDIILVTIDTLRYDKTPLGGGTAAMPTLVKLAARGASFSRAIAPSNVTRRSMPAIMLGASPPRIHGRVVGWALRLDPRHVPFAERLAAAGYDTAGFFCCGSFWDRSKKTGYSRGIASLFIDPEGDVLAAEARRWIEERYAGGKPARPTFAWLHFIEPHNWMKRKDGGTSGAKDSRHRRYDKALAEVDGFLAELVTALDAIPPEHRPILVVTSDHGEGLGDHGAPYHSSDLYDSQVHVPLVIVVPGHDGRSIGETVSITDLAPTLLELAGFVAPTMPDMDGRSLADLVSGARAPDPDGGVAYSVMMTDRSSSQAARAVTRGRYKLIEGSKGIELYDLRADPAEAKNLADVEEHAAVRAELEAVLAERAAIDRILPY